MYIPLIQTFIICLSTIIVFHYIQSLVSQLIEAYKSVHTPLQPITYVNQAPEELLNEIAEIKSKLSAQELSRGIRKL